MVCGNSSNNGNCLYSYLSGEDFQFLSKVPIVLHRPFFTARTMMEGEELDLKLTFLGDSVKHIDFINFILNEFEARGLFKEGYRFVIIDRKVSVYKQFISNNRVRAIKILTPIDVKEDILKVEKVSLAIL